MKSQHRHDLETNELAKRLAAGIEKSRPYGPTILGVLVAIVVGVMLLSYLNSASAQRQSEAWSQYFAAMQTPDSSFGQTMQLLKISAEENPGTPVQDQADITWADGQLLTAAAFYLQDRKAADEAMNHAATTYKTLLKTTSEKRIVDRANFGLGRLYEMRNELDQAKTHYALVGGGFAEIAKQRIEELGDQPTREEIAQTMSWLSTAPLPKRQAPSGPGTPGKEPLFSPGELEMPAAQPSGAGTGGTAPASGDTSTDSSEGSLEDLFKSFDEASKTDDTDRYNTEESATDENATTDDKTGSDETPTSEP